jgi:hypothetical protein
MQRPLKTGLAVLAAASLFAIGGVSSATAAKLITGNDIKDGSVTTLDLSKHANNLLKQKATGKPGPAGKTGPAGKDGVNGKDGKDGLAGAVYRVENYKNGGGGDATVACADDEATSKKYTAISGGVQAGHLGTNDFAVAASFPGRMDWESGKPKADRLDGWIVLGNGKYTDNLKVWALCVPNTSIPVQVVDLDN